jgi:hypothetical protein
MPDLHLGEQVDPAAHQRTGTAVHVDTADLTTHGVIVGMTGSGKTGLAMVMLEELLAAGRPVLCIDPKGDLPNLALAFPGLSGDEFRPWIDESAAAREGVTPEAFAEQQAGTWRDGLAGWGITPDRVAAYRNGMEVAVFTPGSTAGIPVNIVGSLDVPEGSDTEAIHDEIESTVSGLLGLVNVDADPLASREHILLSNLIAASWQAGRDLDLPTLVAQVAQPPLRKLGVFELDTFFPPAERQGLAMRLNGLLASPSFAAWSEGEPLDIGKLLWTPDGRPRAAIVSIAHLSDTERQFVVSLVLSKLVTWMRAQSGTTDLRCLLYMDEVAGYLPPTQNPPTKKPIMLLMKQARAFGVGVVLATQNPVDVDYKALSNAGTWMIGRLQTDRDKARLLDGMQAVAGTVDIAAVDATITGLGKREFVLRKAAQDTPEVFTTRWAMSYLRGPLTRDQIATLMAPLKQAPAPTAAAAPGGTTLEELPPPTGVAPVDLPPPPAGAAPVAAAAPAPAPAVSEPVADDESPMAPKIPDTVPVRYLDPAASWAEVVGAVPGGRRLEPAAVARVRMRFDDARNALVQDEEYEAVIFPLADTSEGADAVAVDYDDRDLLPAPPVGARYAAGSAPLHTKTYWSRLQKSLVDHLLLTETLEVPVNRKLKVVGRIGETPEAFGQRCLEAARSAADADAAKLRTRYEPKVKRLRDQILDVSGDAQAYAAEEAANSQSGFASAAGGLIGSLFGGRKRAASMQKEVAAAQRRAQTAGAKKTAAEQKWAALHQDLVELEGQLADELAAINAEWQQAGSEVETLHVKLKRTNVQVADFVLTWIPR